MFLLITKPKSLKKGGSENHFITRLPSNYMIIGGT